MEGDYLDSSKLHESFSHSKPVQPNIQVVGFGKENATVRVQAPSSEVVKDSPLATPHTKRPLAARSVNVVGIGSTSSLKKSKTANATKMEFGASRLLEKAMSPSTPSSSLTPTTKYFQLHGLPEGKPVQIHSHWLDQRKEKIGSSPLFQHDKRQYEENLLLTVSPKAVRSIVRSPNKITTAAAFT